MWQRRLAVWSSNWKHMFYKSNQKLITLTDGVSEEQQQEENNSSTATMAKIIKSIISVLLVKVPLNSKLHTN